MQIKYLINPITLVESFKVARSGFSVTIPLNFEQLAYHSKQPKKDESFK